MNWVFISIIAVTVGQWVTCGFSFALFVLLGLIFTKAPINWVETVLTIGFCAITWLLYIIDDRFYLYVVEDDEEE